MNAFWAQHPEMVSGEMQNGGTKNTRPDSFLARFVIVVTLVILFEVVLFEARAYLSPGLTRLLQIGAGLTLGLWLAKEV